MIRTAQPRRYTSGWKLPAASLCTLLALSTTGCTGSSGDDTPSPNPTHTIAPVETEVLPSPTPTQLPPPPKEMSEETDEGAIATVKYFINAVNLAYQTNDETLFANLQTNDCESCQAFADEIRTARESGITYDHYTLEVGEVSDVGPIDEVGNIGVNAILKEDKNTETSKAGQSQPESIPTVFIVRFTGDSWRMAGFIV